MMCKGADRVTFQQGDCKGQIWSIFSVAGGGGGGLVPRASFYDRSGQVNFLI